MGLDEARHGDIAELMRQHRRARHLGAELGGGETRGEGEQRAAEAQSERCLFQDKAKPDGAEHKRRREPGSGLVGQSEIGDDTAGEQHRQPEEPAVLLRFKRAG